VESNVHVNPDIIILDSLPSYCPTALLFGANVGLNIENKSTDVMSFVCLLCIEQFFQYVCDQTNLLMLAKSSVLHCASLQNIL